MNRRSDVSPRRLNRLLVQVLILAGLHRQATGRYWTIKCRKRPFVLVAEVSHADDLGRQQNVLSRHGYLHAREAGKFSHPFGRVSVARCSKTTVLTVSSRPMMHPQQRPGSTVVGSKVSAR